MGMSIVNQNDVPLYHKYQLEKVALSKSELLQRKMVFLKTQKSYANGIIRSITLDISQQQLIDHRLSKSLSSSPLVKEFDTVNSSSITTDIATVFTSFWSTNTAWS